MYRHHTKSFTWNDFEILGLLGEYDVKIAYEVTKNGKGISEWVIIEIDGLKASYSEFLDMIKKIRATGYSAMLEIEHDCLADYRNAGD